MFLLENDVSHARYTDNLDLTLGSTHYALTLQAGRVPTAPQTFDSQFAIENLDERLSLDLQMTIPISNKIISVDGQEEHEHILARFPYNNMKKFTTKLVQTDVEMEDSVIIDESFGAGLVDLTLENPNYESNHLLNGDIQQLGISLFTRYYENGKIERIKTDMNDGLWVLRLVFAKKV